MESAVVVRGIDRAAPVVVGGGGGSGTRVAALLLVRMGFFLGNDRNAAEDNLLFTLLFKRPRWHARADRAAIDRALAVLERGILDGCRSSDLGMLAGAAKDMVLYNRDYGFPRRMLWTMRRVRNAFRRPRLDGGAVGWGWKEPNSHMYLDALARRFPAMRYIHVVRHGLDMAFSRNQAQLANWGSMFGIDADGDEAPAARALRFWIRSNQAAIRKAEELFGERFLLLRYDDLCEQPRTEIARLMEFLRMRGDESQLALLASIPQSPDSRGRFRGRDLSNFDVASIDAVEAMGFPVRWTREEVVA